MSEAMKKHPDADVMVNFASLRSAFESTVEAMTYPQVLTHSQIFQFCPLFNLLWSGVCSHKIRHTANALFPGPVRITRSSSNSNPFEDVVRKSRSFSHSYSFFCRIEGCWNKSTQFCFLEIYNLCKFINCQLTGSFSSLLIYFPLFCYDLMIIK